MSLPIYEPPGAGGRRRAALGAEAAGSSAGARPEHDGDPGAAALPLPGAAGGRAALPAPATLAQRQPARQGHRGAPGPRVRPQGAGPGREDAEEEAGQPFRPRLHGRGRAGAGQRLGRRGGGGAGAGGAAGRAAAAGAGAAPGPAPAAGQEGAAEGAAVAVGAHPLPRLLRLEGPGGALLAALHQGGQLPGREVLLAARGHVLQARQVGHQDLPALALPGLVQSEVLHLDPRAVPAHLRVQVLLLSRPGPLHCRPPPPDHFSGGGGFSGGFFWDSFFWELFFFPTRQNEVGEDEPLWSFLFSFCFVLFLFLLLLFFVNLGGVVLWVFFILCC